MQGLLGQRTEGCRGCWGNGQKDAGVARAPDNNFTRVFQNYEQLGVNINIMYYDGK